MPYFQKKTSGGKLRTKLTLARNPVTPMACGVIVTYYCIMKIPIRTPKANAWHNQIPFMKTTGKHVTTLTSFRFCSSNFSLPFFLSRSSKDRNCFIQYLCILISCTHNNECMARKSFDRISLGNL